MILRSSSAWALSCSAVLTAPAEPTEVPRVTPPNFAQTRDDQLGQFARTLRVFAA